MRKSIVIALALLATAAVFAAPPPWDVTVNVTAPADGGPVDSYELFLDGVSLGPVTPGANNFPGLLTAEGSYTFRIDTTNAAGTTLGDPVPITAVDLPLPGKATINIQVGCDPCIVTQ